MAEAHPVGFRWVMKARERGATDHPRRPALRRARAAIARPARPDPGRHRHRLPRRPDPPRARDRVVLQGVRRSHYTNAATIINERLPGHRGPRRRLLRLRPRDGRSTTARRWMYEGGEIAASAGAPRARDAGVRGAAPARACSTATVQRDDTLAAPALRAPDPAPPLRALHAGDGRARSAASPRRTSTAVADALIAQLGPRAHDRALLRRRLDPAHRRRADDPRRRRSCSCCSATSAARAAGSWRCAGTPRSRARPTSRRSTTCCPGYLHMPQRARGGARPRRPTSRPAARPTGWWSNFDKYIVSLLKAWFGDAATPENDFGFGHLPKITGNHSHFPTMLRASTAAWTGCFVMGQNPAVGSQNARPAAPGAGATSSWLVVRDLAEIETRDVLARRARGAQPASCARRTSRPRSSSCPPPRTSRRRAASPTPSACSSGATRRSTRRATPLGAVVHAPPRQAREGALRRLGARPRLADPQPHVGLRRARPPRRARRPRPSCRRSTAATSRPASRCPASRR